MVPLRIWWKTLQEIVLFWLPFNLSSYLEMGPGSAGGRALPLPQGYSLFLRTGGQKRDTPDSLGQGFDS